MKLGFLGILLFSYSNTFSQSVIGLQGGAGTSTISTKPLIVTPSLEIYALKKINSRLFIGGALSMQQYSFSKKTGNEEDNPGKTVLSIEQQSTYIYISPKVDLSIGKNQAVHAYLSAGPGFLVDGKQLSNMYFIDHSVTRSVIFPGGRYNGKHFQENTTTNISKLIFRIQVGITERIINFKRYSVFLFQEFNYIPIPVSKLPYANVTNYKKMTLNTNYLSIGVSINYSYSGKKTAHAAAPEQ